MYLYSLSLSIHIVLPFSTLLSSLRTFIPFALSSASTFILCSIISSFASPLHPHLLFPFLSPSLLLFLHLLSPPFLFPFLFIVPSLFYSFLSSHPPFFFYLSPPLIVPPYPFLPVGGVNTVILVGIQLFPLCLPWFLPYILHHTYQHLCFISVLLCYLHVYMQHCGLSYLVGYSISLVYL